MGLTNKQKIYVSALKNDFQQVLLYLSGRNQRLSPERATFMDSHAVDFFQRLVLEESDIPLLEIMQNWEKVAEIVAYYYHSSIEKLTTDSIKYLAYVGVDRLFGYMTSPVFPNATRDCHIIHLFLGLTRGNAEAWVMSVLPKNLVLETEYVMEFSASYTASEAYQTSLEEIRLRLSQWGLLSFSSSSPVRTHSSESAVSSLTDEHADAIDADYRLVAITDEFDNNQKKSMDQMLALFCTVLQESLDENIAQRNVPRQPFFEHLAHQLNQLRSAHIPLIHRVLASHQSIFMHQISTLSTTQATYIEPDILKDNTRQSLFAYLHDFFSGDLSYCVIHSDQGHGKNRLIEEAQKNLWGSTLTGKHYIPIAIYLEKAQVCYDPTSGQSFFHQYVAHYYHYTDQEITHLTQQGFFVVFVTQIEECTDAKLLAHLATTHFGHGGNNVKMVFLLNHFSLRLDANLTEHVRLAPFNTGQIQDFWATYPKVGADKRLIVLEEHPELLDCIQTSSHSPRGVEALPALLALVSQHSPALLAMKQSGQPLPAMPYLLYQHIMAQQSDDVKELVADLMIAYFEKKVFFVERKEVVLLQDCPFLSATLTRHEHETPYAVVLEEPRSVEEIEENTIYLYLDNTQTHVKYTVRLSSFQVTTVILPVANEIKKTLKQKKSLSESEQEQIYQKVREREHMHGLYYRYTFSQDSWRDYCMAYFLWFFREEQNEPADQHVWNVYALAETFPQVLHFMVQMLQDYHDPDAAGLFFYQKFNAHGYQDCWSNAYNNTQILLAEATLGRRPVVFSWRPHSPSFYEDMEDASVDVIQVGDYRLKLIQPFDYRTIPEKTLYLYLDNALTADLTLASLQYGVRTPEGMSIVGILDNPAYANVKKRLAQGFNLTKSQVNSILETLHERGHVIYTTTTDKEVVVHENQSPDILRVRVARCMQLNPWNEKKSDILTKMGHLAGVSVQSPTYLSPYDGTYKGLEDWDDRQSIQSNPTDQLITQKLYDTLLESIKHPEGWYEVCLMSTLPANEQPEHRRLYLSWLDEQTCCYKTESIEGTAYITLDELSDEIGLPRALLFFDALKEKRLTDVEDFQDAILAITAERGHTPIQDLRYWIPNTIGLTQTAGLRRITDGMDKRNMQLDLLAYIDWIQENLLSYQFDILLHYVDHETMDCMKIYVEVQNDVLYYVTALTPKKQSIKKSRAIQVLGQEKADILFDVLGGPDVLQNKAKANSCLADFLTLSKEHTPVQAGTHHVNPSILRLIKKETLSMKVYQLQRELDIFFEQRAKLYREKCRRDGLWYNEDDQLVEPSVENIDVRLERHQTRLRAEIRRFNQIIHDEILSAREDLSHRFDAEKREYTRLYNECMIEIALSGHETTQFIRQVNQRFAWLMGAFPKTAQKYSQYSSEERTAFSEAIALGDVTPLVDAFITTFVQEENIGFQEAIKQAIKTAQLALFAQWLLQQTGNLIGNFWHSLEESAQKIIQDAIALGKINLALTTMLSLDEDSQLDEFAQETLKRGITDCINEGVAEGVGQCMTAHMSTASSWLAYSVNGKQRFIAMIRTLRSQKNPDFSVIADEFPELLKKPSAFYLTRYLCLGFSPDAVGHKKEPLLFFALRLFANEPDIVKSTQYFRVIEYLCNTGATINIRHDTETCMSFIVQQYAEYSKQPGVETSLVGQIKLKQWEDICSSGQAISDWFERNAKGKKALQVLIHDFSANAKQYEAYRFPPEDAPLFIKIQAFFSNLLRPERILLDRRRSLERVPGELAAFERVFNLPKRIQQMIEKAENCEKMTSSLGLLSQLKIQTLREFLKQVESGKRGPLGQKQLVVSQKPRSFFSALFSSSPKEARITKQDAQKLREELNKPIQNIRQNEMKKLATENKKLSNEAKVAKDETKAAEIRAKIAEDERKVAEDENTKIKKELDAMKKIFLSSEEPKKSSAEEPTASTAESKKSTNESSRKSSHAPTFFQSQKPENPDNSTKATDKSDELNESEKDNDPYEYQSTNQLGSTKK